LRKAMPAGRSNCHAFQNTKPTNASPAKKCITRPIVLENAGAISIENTTSSAAALSQRSNERAIRRGSGSLRKLAAQNTPNNRKTPIPIRVTTLNTESSINPHQDATTSRMAPFSNTTAATPISRGMNQRQLSGVLLGPSKVPRRRANGARNASEGSKRR
jgi:hypothetical protein